MSECDPCSVGGCEYIFCCVVCDVGYSVGACVSACCVVSGCSLTGMFIIYCVVLDCGPLESLSMLCRVVCDSGG